MSFLSDPNLITLSGCWRADELIVDYIHSIIVIPFVGSWSLSNWPRLARVIQLLP
jgi:hypothetical protein